jgi:hypothetical protein
MAPSPAPGPSRRTASLASALGASEVGQVTGVLPSTGREVSVPEYVRREALWRGELPSGFSSVPNKLACELDGIALYPELIVVRLLERAGWGAAWHKRWGTAAYWRDIGDEVEPPPFAVSIVDQVSRQAGHVAPWDIIAWRGRQLRFIVSRAGGGQRMGAYLASWLDAALRMGIPLGCFAVVEQLTDRPPRRRRLAQSPRRSTAAGDAGSDVRR